MSKEKGKKSDARVTAVEVDPTECPFREFRDNELAQEFWGLGPAACRHAVINKVMTKLTQDIEWMDEQTQPLPRSVRHYLHGWVRAEELAADRWDAEVVIFEDVNHGKLSVMDTQLSHTQVLLRSSFCRRVLSTCYILERVEGFQIEHTWENFAFNFGPEGWRARYHIYSPGMKAGGGQQHRPGLSKNGCYLVRLYFLGAWRCVWVSDQVPVDGFDSPLLPFSPLLSNSASKNPKAVPTLVTSSVVHLWPLLLCKALLKLAAPDMNDDEEELVDDETLPEFDMFHALTGCLSLTFHIRDYEGLWTLLTSEVHNFTWDEDDETVVSTIKSKSVKKPQTKERPSQRSVTTMIIAETKDLPAYALPGITPAHEMKVLVTMTRDLPLKKPLPEPVLMSLDDYPIFVKVNDSNCTSNSFHGPDVSPWKLYRWVAWARRHGLYEAYECPRTRYLKVNGLMKLSYAPHLLDVQSTESITFCFREEQEKATQAEKKKKLLQQLQQEANKSAGNVVNMAQLKEELREWMQYTSIQPLVLLTNVFYYPSLFNFTSAASNPPIRITKSPLPKNLDIPAPKSAPLYLQIDGPGMNKLLMSLSMLHPIILLNCRAPMEDYVEKAYIFLEIFEWFKEKELPRAKAYIQTRGYGSVECFFPPGRHFCRLWMHSRTNCHVTAMSESSLVLGTRDAIQAAAVRECPWSHKFLINLQQSFNNWIRQGRSMNNVIAIDRDFSMAYQPDLPWDPKVVGYEKSYVHWMFRQALQSLLHQRMLLHDFQLVCPILRYYFCDPDFGMPPKPDPSKIYKDVTAKEPCDCVMPEPEETAHFEEEEQQLQVTILVPEEHSSPIVSNEVMSKLLVSPTHPVTSQVCELASEQLPCAVLKTEREKVIRKHEAATLIQAHWRGAWARKCLRSHVHLTPEVNKMLMENAFGNLDSLSFLMNEFFMMFPGVKYAYSVSSAISGVYGLNQHQGTSPLLSKCKWIPYFQGVFFCHHNVKVHFDIQSTIPYNALAVYDNDSGERLPQANNAHLTFNFVPNIYGYTVLGHGTLNLPPIQHGEVHWQLTVMTSIDNVFHICDNPDTELCTILPLQPATKLHLNEMFMPNRRNILGGIHIAVTKVEAVCFRAESTQPDLDIEAVLRTTNSDGDIEEIARCTGKGEIFWPYIRLKPSDAALGLKKRSVSHALLPIHSELTTRSGRLGGEVKSAKGKPSSAKAKFSATKLKDVKPAPIESKQYTIEVIAPNGWPLSLEQWKRVDEIRNSLEAIKVEIPTKKTLKEKGVTTKDKGKVEERERSPIFIVHQPMTGDAYTVLECSTAVGGGALAKRDDERDILFATTRRSWETKEPGRNARGEKIREAFRAEHLMTQPSSVTKESSLNEIFTEDSEEESAVTTEKKETRQRPSPVTESGILETTIEAEEELMYYHFPEPLRDKFVPLHFVPLCTKEKVDEESVLLTPEIEEAANKERHEHIESALARMRDLQTHNEVHILEQQQTRTALLEKLFIDAQWGPDLAMALDERDASIAREVQEIQANTKKKQQDKEKEKNIKPEVRRKT